VRPSASGDFRIDFAGGSMTKSEQETIVRYDQQERILHLYTAYPADARRWGKLGYNVIVERWRDGQPSGWHARAPVAALRLRRLLNGQVRKRASRRSVVIGTPLV